MKTLLILPTGGFPVGTAEAQGHLERRGLRTGHPVWESLHTLAPFHTPTSSTYSFSSYCVPGTVLVLGASGEPGHLRAALSTVRW